MYLTLAQAHPAKDLRVRCAYDEHGRLTDQNAASASSRSKSGTSSQLEIAFMTSYRPPEYRESLVWLQSAAATHQNLIAPSLLPPYRAEQRLSRQSYCASVWFNFR